MVSGVSCRGRHTREKGSAAASGNRLWVIAGKGEGLRRDPQAWGSSSQNARTPSAIKMHVTGQHQLFRQHAGIGVPGVSHLEMSPVAVTLPDMCV